MVHEDRLLSDTVKGIVSFKTLSIKFSREVPEHCSGVFRRKLNTVWRRNSSSIGFLHSYYLRGCHVDEIRFTFLSGVQVGKCNFLSIVIRGKLEIIKREMERLYLDVVGMIKV